MSLVNEIKGQIYDEIVKHKTSERNIAILEGKLQEELKKSAQVVPEVVESTEIEINQVHNNL